MENTEHKTIIVMMTYIFWVYSVLNTYLIIKLIGHFKVGCDCQTLEYPPSN